MDEHRTTSNLVTKSFGLYNKFTETYVKPSCSCGWKGKLYNTRKESNQSEKDHKESREP